MKNSIDELSLALELLNGCIYNAGKDATNISRDGSDYHGNSLSYSGNLASEISEKFKNTNSDLSNAWDTTGQFLKKIYSEVDDIVGQYAKGLYNYIEATRENEEMAKGAAEKANAEAEEILRELGL